MLIKNNKHIILLSLIIIAYTLIFTFLSYFRYRALFSYEWEDEAEVHQLIYNTSKGNFLLGQTTQRETCRYGLNDHVEPIYLLFSVIYKIVPNITTLYFLRALFIAASIIPLYLIFAYKLGNKNLAVLFGGLFLLFSPLNYMHLTSLKMIQYFVPIGLLNYYYFSVKRYKDFIFCLFAALFIHETVVFFGIAFAILALIEKRNVKWVIAPIVICGIYGFVAFKIILPLITMPGYSSFVQGGGGANNLNELLIYTITHPTEILKNIHDKSRIDYLIQIFKPTLFLAILAPTTLILAVSQFLQLLLAVEPITNAKGHWLTMIVPFVYLSSIFGLIKIYNYFKTDLQSSKLSKILQYLLILIFTVSIISSNMGNNILGQQAGDFIHDARFINVDNIFDKEYYMVDKNDLTAWKLINMVPKDSTVTATGDLLVPLSHRSNLKEFGRNYVNYLDSDFMLLNTQIMYNGSGHYALLSQDQKRNAELIDRQVNQLLASKKWIIKEKENSFYLLKRILP